MHTHDRTLLARLGFSDPDKKEPLHDRACAYLAEDAQARRLISMVDDGALPPPRGWDWSRRSWCQECTVEEARDKEDSTASIFDDGRIGGVVATLERPLTKGSGQYASTLGFLDTCLGYWFEGHQVGWETSGTTGTLTEKRHPLDRWETTATGTILIEVKIARVPMGDAMRQMNLYAQHRHSLYDMLPLRYRITDERVRTKSSLFLATAYPVTKADVAILARENVRHIRLGDGFKAWLARPSEDDESPLL